MAVDAVLRLKGSTNLDMIHYIKQVGGSLSDSFLDEGFVLNKKIGVGQPKRIGTQLFFIVIHLVLTR